MSINSLLLCHIKNEDSGNVAKVLDEGGEINKVHSDGMAPIHVAVRKGSHDMVSLLLSYDCDVNLAAAKDVGGMTALHFAARLGYFDIAEDLIRAKADVNARATSDATPLHEAALNGQEKILRLLLKFEADPLLIDYMGMCPHRYAKKAGFKELAKELPDVPFNTWEFDKKQPDFMAKVEAIKNGGKKKKKGGKKKKKK